MASRPITRPAPAGFPVKYWRSRPARACLAFEKFVDDDFAALRATMLKSGMV
ncbi:hypothetical protein [Polaromonas sp.]|uniref:hypothetical protein n=1 Tax=Polaromonas sp. TaxID=1869339 RepID=UPI003BB71A3C